MLFSRRLPLPDLISLCRSLRHNLEAGITIHQIFNQQAKRGPKGVRPVAERMYQFLKRGENLQTALEEEQAVFPPLFIALVGVGEHTGTLPEVFAALEEYYQLQQRLWRQLVSQSTLPVVQFVAASFIVAGLLLILGIIADMHGTKAMDPIGLGTGPQGALTFLFLVYGLVGGLVGIYIFSRRFLQQRAVIDQVLLRLPAIGPCLYVLAMSRFCVSLRFTLDTSLPIAEALDLSLRATGNSAFAVRSAQVEDSLRGGGDLTTALADTRLFTEEFITIVATAEESGRLPEVMKHQAEFFEEEAERKMTLLTRMTGFGVWCAVAIVIIIAIFRIAMIYINAINQALG